MPCCRLLRNDHNRSRFFPGVRLSVARRGPASAFLRGEDPQLNLEVVDLETNAHMRVFDHQVAMGYWQQSIRGDPLTSLYFTGVLILPARVEDTDQDGKITSHDASALYRFDLAERRRRRISPEGYHVSSFFFQSDQIVLFLLQEPEREETSVYVYTPAMDRGKLVAQALKP